MITPLTLDNLKAEIEKFTSIGYSITVMEHVPYEGPIDHGYIDEDNLPKLLSNLGRGDFYLIVEIETP